ncbi:hypothetical protein [Salipiger sp. PrR003]|uniref:hypothetical protein n=1 Tax=Salipiger sp. PrR003 TaxID=2706776 RepID=UPI0013D9FF05|nr:hypothetical protein [Salipiger sp. PrR003]NDV50562.1 hypothetical protein [Salipiger sp. PrR003]
MADQSRPVLNVSGSIAESLTTATRVDLALTTTFARNSDNQDVLLPLLDCRLIGKRALSDAEPAAFFSGILSLDNGAYITAMLVDELARSLDHLAALTEGPAVKHELDTAQIREWLRNATTRLQHAESLLDSIDAASSG